MHSILIRCAGWLAIIGLIGIIAGCGSETDQNRAAPDDGSEATAGDSTAPAKPKFAPLDISTDGAGGAAKSNMTDEEKLAAVKQNLKPLLPVIGKWNGTIQRKVGVEKVAWLYDVGTDKNHPGLKMQTEDGGYLKEGRLTYLPEEEKYQFTATENDGAQLEFVGTFSVEPHDVIDSGDSKKNQRAFKLELKRENEEPKHKLTKVVFNQQDNGRYLFELYDKRGRRFDTINTMREGRSFAVSEDYGDKECVISQGLGTISIDYKGKTYWVCCSGCKAEFEAEPDKWIAKYEAQKAMKK